MKVLENNTSSKGASVVCWPVPAAKCELQLGEVHLWCALLDPSTWPMDELAEVLSPDEQDRATRYRLKQDQKRFVVGRALLRRLLGFYLGREPGALQFGYSPSGKPFLCDSAAEPALDFNLAHSQDVAVYALTRGRKIGVDVEAVRSMRDREEIARRFFSPNEVDSLRSVADERRDEAFFNCWTRKEAYLKAIGNGIGDGLNHFEVSLLPDEPAALLRHRIDADEILKWSLFDLRPARGFTGALAVEGNGLVLKCWQLAPDGEFLTSRKFNDPSEV